MCLYFFSLTCFVRRKQLLSLMSAHLFIENCSMCFHPDFYLVEGCKVHDEHNSQVFNYFLALTGKELIFLFTQLFKRE